MAVYRHRVAGGFGFTTQPRAGFMTTAYRQRTELGFVARRLVPNRFAAVVAGGKSISADFKIRRRPGFDWAVPLVLVHA